MPEIKLFKHQERALDETEQFNRVAYYLDMGLGKTFVGSEKLWELNAEYNLVICQKSKVNDWYEHFVQYYPEYSVVKYENQSNFKPNSILIVNYEKAWRRPQLSKLHDFTLMLDESSKVKNEKSKQTKFILKLKPDNVILLSGTPTGGKYEELWSQCRLLGWKIDKIPFLKRYTIQQWNHELSFYELVGYQNVDELIRKLHEYGAIFQKTEDVFDLPKQNHINIDVKSTADYRTFKRDHYLVREGEEIKGEMAITAKLFLRKLAGAWNPNKLAALNELIESTNDRLIIFYNFNIELDELKKIAKKHKRPISIINGQTKDLKQYDKSDNSITLVQYQAGAMGLNLQKANKIVYFTLTDKSELFEQSKKRIHRIGQDKPCFYYYLLTKGSIEPKMLNTLKMRKDYTDKLFEKDW